MDGNARGETIFTRIVNVNMVGTKVADRAAIVSRTGQTFAASEGLKITPQQIQDIAAAINDPAPLAASGINLGDEHFIYQMATPGEFHGVNKDGSRQCTVVATRELLLVGIYFAEGRDVAKGMMEDLQGYFRDQGV